MKNKYLSVQNFTIDVGERARTVFTVKERENSELLILPKHARYIEDFAAGTQSLHEVNEFHYSVHRSEDSKLKINVIPRTLSADGAPILKSGQYTKAIKHNRFYAVLYGCRCPTLDREYHLYNQKTNETKVSLGSYNPKRFQLIYQVLVSGKDTPKPVVSTKMNIRQVDFALFRVTVLWAFISIPSMDIGQMLNVATLPPEEIHLHNAGTQEIFRVVEQGLDPSQLKSQFLVFASVIKTLFFERLVSETPKIDPKDHKMIELNAKFSKRGN